MNNRTITLNELLSNFRNALASLVPYLENIKITYKERDAYDEWDHISEILYEEMVINIIKSSAKSVYSEDYAKYGFYYDNYKKLDFLAFSRNNSNDLFVFNSFSANDNFNKIIAHRISKNTLTTISKKELIDYKDISFYFKTQGTEIINKIDIL